MPALKENLDAIFAKLLTHVGRWRFWFAPIVLASFTGSTAIWPVLAQASSGDQVIAECSAGSFDEAAIFECVTQKFEQAEASLRRTEQSWQRVLQEQTSTPEVQKKVEATSTADNQGSSSVIAIVNDTAIQSGIATGGARVINVDKDSEINEEKGQETFDTSVQLSERFGFLPALFRSYRDQHCAWQSTLFGEDRVRLHYLACLTSLTLNRTNDLTRSLALRRAINKHGRSYSGYYVKTDEGALFQACNRKTDWWVTGSDSVLSALSRRYLDINAQRTVAGDLLYAEVSGGVVSAPVSGSGADYESALFISNIGLLRPVAEQDCSGNFNSGNLYSGNVSSYSAQGVVQTAGLQAANSVEGLQSDAATVDDYASSGFLYGYFNDWLTACAVTETSVCSAETEAQFASDGDWQLRVDRSLEGDWRILLIPTTDDQLIEKQLTMQINGAEVYLDRVFDRPLQLALNQGRTIADGELARELIVKLRQGRELRLEWFDDSDVMSELKFSLLGVTRALEYFDHSKQ